MHPRLAELFDYAGTQRRALLAAVEAVPLNGRDHRILFVGQHEARHAAQMRAWAGAGAAG